MNFYPFHIGDYRGATAHLTAGEDLAYRRLLDMYYDTESPLPDDLDFLSRRVRAYKEEIATVLADFFTLRTDFWYHDRCEHEIEKYRKMSEGGKAGAAKRWGKDSYSPPIPTLCPPVSLPNANQEPLTKNQEPVIKEAKASLSGSKLPDCPHKEILKLWEKHLPNLTQPRTWDGARAQALKARWVQASKDSSWSTGGYKTLEEGLKFWDDFFGYIANNTTLPRGFKYPDGRVWLPDLPWVANATNFAKIVDFKYHKE